MISLNRGINNPIVRFTLHLVSKSHNKSTRLSRHPKPQTAHLLVRQFPSQELWQDQPDLVSNVSIIVSYHLSIILPYRQWNCQHWKIAESKEVVYTWQTKTEGNSLSLYSTCLNLKVQSAVPVLHSSPRSTMVAIILKLPSRQRVDSLGT